MLAANSRRAVGHWLPFSHALMAALIVMTLTSREMDVMKSNKRSACCQRPHFLFFGMGGVLVVATRLKQISPLYSKLWTAQKKNKRGTGQCSKAVGPAKHPKVNPRGGANVCLPSHAEHHSYIFLSEFIWFVSCFHASLSSWQTHEMFSSSAHCRIHSYSWGKTPHQWNSQRKDQAQFLFRGSKSQRNRNYSEDCTP